MDRGRIGLAIAGAGAGIVHGGDVGMVHQRLGPALRFEAGDHLGGHTHTHDIELGSERYAVDTGFIVFNDWTYPNFIALMEELGVSTQPAENLPAPKAERASLRVPSA